MRLKYHGMKMLVRGVDDAAQLEALSLCLMMMSLTAAAAAVWGLVFAARGVTDRQTDMLITILRYLRQLSGAS